MIVLTLEPGEADKLAEGAPGLQRRYGMPIAPHPYPRAFSSEPACRAVVAIREYCGEHGAALLLRGLRVRAMAGGLLDDERLIRSAGTEAGVYPSDLRLWMASARTEAALRADIAAARDPSPGARALDHKLGGPREQRRYTAPSYELQQRRAVDQRAGLQPGRGLRDRDRQPRPGRRQARATGRRRASCWSGPTCRWRPPRSSRSCNGPSSRSGTQLAQVATPRPAGADMYWSLQRPRELGPAQPRACGLSQRARRADEH